MEFRLHESNKNTHSFHFLKGIYELINPGSELTYGCVPNGEIGISIILSGKSEMKTDSGWVQQPQASVYGLVKKVQFHRMSPAYREINLGFQPHLLQPFLKVRLNELPERVATNLEDIMPKSEVAQIIEEFSYCNTDEQIRDVAERFLGRNLKAPTIDKRIIEAHDLITNKKITRVEQLSDQLQLSTAGLRNLFRDSVGISPKDLIKIHRIKRALHSKLNDEESLTQLAYSLDYYDQAHFIHEFKQSIGVTPKLYFQNQKLTFDFYNYKRFSYDSFGA
jgi:AraC-like DNA-binding protein